MDQKIVSERLFEKFCESNSIDFKKINEGQERRPDYLIKINGMNIIVEIKQIDEDENFGVKNKTDISLNSRIPGKHVRKKIEQARDQVRTAAKNGYITILLIYNNLDRFQFFGTEDHDFLHGMFGELTIDIDVNSRSVSSTYYGKNRALRKDKNQNFSAVGRIKKSKNGAEIHIWENPYARNKIDFQQLPKYISWNKINIEVSKDKKGRLS